MSDERQRELERRAAAGDADASRALAWERMRSVDLPAVADALRRDPRGTLRLLVEGFTRDQVSDLIAELGVLRLARDRGDTVRERIRSRPQLVVGDVRRRGLERLVLELALGPLLGELPPTGGVRVTVTVRTPREVELEAAGWAHWDPPATAAALSASAAATLLGNLEADWAVVAALSESFEASRTTLGERRTLRCARGEVQDLSSAPAAPGEAVRLRFEPDREVFAVDLEIDGGAVERRLREVSPLHPGVELRLIDPVRGRDTSFVSLGGLADVVADLCPAERSVLGAIVRLPWALDGLVQVEAAITYRTGTDEPLVVSYAGDRLTRRGGSHALGLQEGVADAVAAAGGARHAATRGLVAAVAICGDVQEPERGQPLADASAATSVRERVREGFATWLAAHPRETAALLERLGTP